MKHNDPIQDFEQQLRSLTPRVLSDETVDAIQQGVAQTAQTAQAEPAPRPLRAWWALAPLAAAACVVLAFTLIGPGNNNTATDTADAPDNTTPDRTPDTTPKTKVALANWRVLPTGDARYTVVAPGRIQLDQGELYIESTHAGSAPADRQRLTIITPQGDAHATGTRFYIGSHSGPTPQPSTKDKAMKRFTRILILSGVVTLTNPLGSITGQANELLAAEVDTAPTKIVVQANADFAIGLYGKLSEENANKNVFFSPYSISSALSMAAEGARGQTAREMGDVLGFPKKAQRLINDAQRLPWQMSLIHTGYAQINGRLNRAEGPDIVKKRAEAKSLRKQLAASNAKADKLDRAGKWKEFGKAIKENEALAKQINAMEKGLPFYELKVANALWGDQAYAFNPGYIDTISKHYGTDGVNSVDFQKNYPAAAKRINDWAAKHTNQRIKDLVPEEGSPLTRLILTNAIYFKGEWAEPFDVESTEDLPFMFANGKSAKTPIMYGMLKTARYAAFNADGSLFNTPMKVPVDDDAKQPARYPGAKGFAIAELPYKGDELSMVLIAPNSATGLPAIEKLLTQDLLNGWIGKLKKRETGVYLPKLKLETRYMLADTLKAMGIKQAFTRPTPKGGADFTGISASENFADRLWIGNVIHKTFLQINEKGTEAAAATAVIMDGGGIPKMIPFEPEFNADRPFIFLIRDKQTGTILFMGRMMDPTAK